MKKETAKAAAAEIYRQFEVLGPQCKLVVDEEVTDEENIFASLATPANRSFGLKRSLQGNIVVINDQLAFARRAERAVQEWLDNGLESMFRLINYFLSVHGAAELKPSLSQEELVRFIERFIPDVFDLDCFKTLHLKLMIRLGHVYASETDEDGELKDFLPLAGIEAIYQAATAAERAQDPNYGTWRTRPPLI